MTQIYRHTGMPVASPHIVKGIPVPPRMRISKYPFRDMVVGDAMFSVYKSLSASASGYAKKHGGKFTTRPYTLDGVEGYMSWKIA